MPHVIPMWPVVGTGEGWPVPPVHQQMLGLTTVMLGLPRVWRSLPSSVICDSAQLTNEDTWVLVLGNPYMKVKEILIAVKHKLWWRFWHQNTTPEKNGNAWRVSDAYIMYSMGGVSL